MNYERRTNIVQPTTPAIFYMRCYKQIFVMILRRFGNKSKLATEIQKYFPPHNTYIEPFLGAGRMFFNKPKAKHNFLNDLDSNVYNCFTVLMREKQSLVNYLEYMPVHSDFWNECKIREPETNIEKAVYFIFLSNFGYMGAPETLLYQSGLNPKQITIENIEKTYLTLAKNGNVFMNEDFRNVIKKISFRKERDKDNAFVYSDPPYFQTKKYISEWTEKDVNDCFDITFNSGIKAAMSEFDHPFILEQAEKRNLNVIIIGERKNLKNRRTEILVTNYQKAPTLF